MQNQKIVNEAIAIVADLLEKQCGMENAVMHVGRKSGMLIFQQSNEITKP